MHRELFDNSASKVVTKTDKDKGAYVLNEAQRAVLAAAGIVAGQGGENASRFEIDVPNDPNGLQLSVSYYDSIRKGAGRTPEARMGRDVVRWMEVGDEITLANIGPDVFAWKENAPALPLTEIAGSVADTADKARLIAKANRAKGKPPRQNRTVADFLRNAAVVAGALARAEGACETPKCKRDTFRRVDGTVYLEVHHITPLAEGGDDTLLNAAALCPTCHRELHYGAKKMELREQLRASVKSKATAP